ncbi:aminomethyl-transferring glycine dehydrogenase subunit GcvPA [Sulfuriflexus sp.]|uniref:aminomethyl-transferring glycine dehydrogenase subunit GcvPA n=1 Tax=Sulfuriflexus sp. TaxID=2015443 RepID=UPI0028CE2DB0|nr:aminomethyl-transferring glycine dehydrogenase subunit GcvPA [Sulfuriflexus sp.]MDT8403371.1 aminomethyl-transferring glycine dehydrogenase subunit GcvPA [Sulfuriflexus sp.]
MPFIPHTEEDIRSMLEAIGADSIDDLFDEIPAGLRSGKLETVPEMASEMDVARLMHARAAQDAGALCFIGAGAYEHHIPAAVWELTTRGEFYSAYTPYQAEASQGTLQLLYEFQTMMASLTGMEVSNASLYDGASGLAEAVLMAVRANRKSKSKRILVPRTVHPHYRQTAHTIVKNQGLVLEELDYDRDSGVIDPASLPAEPGDITAVVIPYPNFFGGLEEVDRLTNWAHEHGALVIAVVNPFSLGLLKAPGQWGETGADIVCGEGQPLGIPLASGGPYYGIMCCKQAYVRQMPGRIIGRTVDLDGKPGYTLTLQAREQHIRRSKATSNICTNQGLMVTASTIHMSLLGAEGLKRAAALSHANSEALKQRLSQIEGVQQCFRGPGFHEFVLQLELPVVDVLRELASSNILGGYALTEDYPELGEALLVCATETRTAADIEAYATKLERVFVMQNQAS